METARCDLCEEVDLAGMAVTGQVNAPFSRLLHRSEGVDILAGLGSLAPGYLLVVTHRHLRSAGELPQPDARRFWKTTKAFAKKVTQAFNCDVFIAEHGSSSGRNTKGRSCIEHAHAHIFPVPRGTDLDRFCPPGSRAARRSDLAAMSSRGESYFYCTDLDRKLITRTDDSFISQYGRIRWAEILGRSDEWDWAAFPEFNGIHETLRGVGMPPRLTPSSVVPDDDTDLASTLSAYNGAASWYATRTADYPPDSKLRGDVQRFVEECPAGPLLDAGAGGGRDSRFMASLGRTVVALDAAEGLLREGRVTGRTSRAVGDVRELPMATASLAGLWCSAVLLHLPEAESRRALAEFARVVVDGGLMHVSVKDGCGSHRAPVPGRPELSRQFYLYEAPRLEAMVTESGFKVLDIWTDDEPDDSIEGTTTWLKCLTKRHR